MSKQHLNKGLQQSHCRHFTDPAPTRISGKVAAKFKFRGCMQGHVWALWSHKDWNTILTKISTHGSPKRCLGITLSCSISAGWMGETQHCSPSYVFNCSARLEGWNSNVFYTKYKRLFVTFNFVKVLRWVSRGTKMLRDDVEVESRRNLDKYQDIKKREKREWLTMREDCFLMLNFYHIQGIRIS